MKSFIEFLSEAQWMYHGSTRDISNLVPDRSEYMIDRAIGSHFAADPQISKKFTRGKGWENETPDAPKGNLYRTKAPPRSKLLVVKQKRYAGGLQSDQNAIASHVAGTVFRHDKDLFKQHVMSSRNIDEPTAELLHDHLSKGKSPSDTTKFGMAAQKGSSFESFVHNYGVPHDQDLKRKIVDKYLDIMKSRGIKGLVYTNTSPMETKGMPQDTHPNYSNYRKPGEKGSRKNYVIFDPSEHHLEKIPH